jgi:hypothetical protein
LSSTGVAQTATNDNNTTSRLGPVGGMLLRSGPEAGGTVVTCLSPV